jgi:hypothetical protein
MRHLILFAALFLGAAHGRTPEETVRIYFDKIKAEGMGSVAKLTHPDELVKFQQMMAPVVELALQEAEGRRMFGQFSDPADETKPRKLTPEEFMSVFLQWVESVQPQISQALKGSSIDIIGHVKEGEVSHVVTRFRTKMQGLEIEKMSVISTKDHNGVALMTLSGEIKQMAEVLRARRK